MDATTLRARLLEDHGETVEAAAVALAGATGQVRTPADRETAAATVERVVEGEGLGAALVGAVADAVTATGATLPAEPVAAPPYLVPTARGVLVRMTTDDGRAVVLVRAFALTDGGRYAALDDDAERLSVTVR